jgi:DNA-binding response OmpR family regulator
MEDCMPSHLDRPKRVLIVEDEAAIAFELEELVRDAGFLPVGPALSTAEATQLVSAGGFDAALIDVGMVELEPSGVLADLLKINVPFLYLTGYGSTELPRSLPTADTVLKPFPALELASRLRDLLQARPTHLASA